MPHGDHPIHKNYLPTYARCDFYLRLQPGQAGPFETGQNLTSVGHQKDEVYGFPSHLWSTSPGPIEVCGHQATTLLRFSMHDHSTSPPIGVKDRGRIGWRRIYIETDRPEGVSTVHKDIT